MAKKKEKVIDLKPKADNVTEQELTNLKSIVSEINSIQLEVGRLEAQKHNYLHRLAATRDKAAVIQSELERKYGSSDININDGSINYKEDAK